MDNSNNIFDNNNSNLNTNNNNTNNGNFNTNPISNQNPSNDIFNTNLNNATPTNTTPINNGNVSNNSFTNPLNTNINTNVSNINQMPTQNSQSINNLNSTGNNTMNTQQQINQNQSMNNASIQNNNINSQQPVQPQTLNQMTSGFNDEELLKAFIGKNYEKITKNPFNIPAFFFTSLYMFYRKMFLYSLLVFIAYLIILNVVNNFFVTILFNVAIGFVANKIYLYYTKNQINKIKVSNMNKTTEELKVICSDKGGTSVGKMFLGLFTQFIIALIVLIIMAIAGIGGAIGKFFNPNNWDITVNDGSNNTNTNDNTSTGTGTLLEDVSVNGYGCMNSKCNVTIENSNGDSEDYVLGINNSEFFNKLGDYSDYIKLNIYYTKKGNSKIIVDYKIYSKTTNEEITNVNSENDLRDKLGLYSIGTHTATLTLKEIGTTGFGFENDNSYTYTTYTFIDDKNNEYEMKYINDNGTLNLSEGNKYKVTFEVKEGKFDYEFIIKSIN